VTLATATVVFTDSGDSFPLAIGGMDPIDTLSGMFGRLKNLGYIGGDVQLDTENPLDNLDALRTGLRALKAAQAGGGAGNAAPPSAPASSPSPQSAPPSSALESGPASGATTDDGGLGDDGTLDADTESLLLKVYGS
jgi:hypothetical protein